MYPEVDNLVTELSNCYWGPRPAHQLFRRPYPHCIQGVLNLVYAVQDGIEIPKEQEWFDCLALGGLEVDDYPIYEWATLYKPPQFYEEIVKPNPVMFNIRSLSEWRGFCFGND